MSVIYKETNVFEEALKRVNMVFDHNDDVIVAMSGGKDSTVTFNLALMVARERGRLPLKVFWLDQEAEWQHTVDYVSSIMHMPEVKPLWFQVPFEFPNNLSTANGAESLLIWDENAKDKWIHPKSDIAITENPMDVSDVSRDKAFYILMNGLPEYCVEDGAESCAVLSGMRIAESLKRRTTIMYGKDEFMGETWARRKRGKVQVFWVIYDFTDDDVWTAIGKNHWKYNGVYDLMYRYGVSKHNMRCSALIHETAYAAIELLQEFEPATYNRFVQRVSGTSSVSHAFDYGEVMPQTLPFMFKDWKEYRDYLLKHIIEPKYWEHYKNEWKGQDSEKWYRTHVREVIINDTCGTINRNAESSIVVKDKVKSEKFLIAMLKNI